MEIHMNYHMDIDFHNDHYNVDIRVIFSDEFHMDIFNWVTMSTEL